MCGRYNIVTNAEALIDAFEIIHSDEDIDENLPNNNDEKCTVRKD